jgi:hypothetical protein
MGEACGKYEEKGNSHSILVGKPDGRNHLEDRDVD